MQPAPLCLLPTVRMLLLLLLAVAVPANPPLRHPNPSLPPLHFPSMALSLLTIPAPLLLSKAKAFYPSFATTPAPGGCGMPDNCLMKCLREPLSPGPSSCRATSCTVLPMRPYSSLRPDSFDISIILRICASLCLPNHGKELHCFGLKSGYLEDLFVANGLVTMYSSCGLLRFSRVVFWGIRKPDLVSWTCMLTGLVKNGHEDKVLMLLEQMAWAGISFDDYVLSIGLRASANLNCVGSGKQIHCCLVKYGLDSHCFLGNSLMEFYGRVGELGLMRMLFDRMVERDLVS